MSVVAKHITQINWKDKKLLLACSGGVDSVSLFHAFIELQLPFAVLHVNYQLRDQDSDDDEIFVRNLCRQHGIPVLVEKCPTELTKTQGNNLQNEARKFRHTLFRQWTDLSENHFVVLAHHDDDQIETFFLQYFRGSGSFGLGGMHQIKKGLIRPLLGLSKQTILEEASKKGLIWQEDNSNAESKYLRNLLRNAIIPALEKEIPTLKESIFLFQKELRKETARIEAEYTARFNQIIESGDILISEWENLDETTQFLFIRKMGIEAWAAKQLNTIVRLDLSAEFFTSEYHFFKGRDSIYFRKQSEVKKNWEYKILPSIDVKEFLNSHLRCSTELIEASFIIRGAKPTDKIQLKGMKGKKSVWDLLKSAGVPRQIRSELPVLEYNGEILWIPNFAVSSHPFVEKSNSSTVCIALIEKVK